MLRRPWSPAETWSFVEVLLASPSLELLVDTPRHAAVLAALFTDVPQLAGNLCTTVEVGVARFPGIEVRDPLLPA